MNEQSGASVGTHLFLCKAISNVEDVKRVTRFLYEEGFFTADGTHPNARIIPRQDIDSFVETRHIDDTIFGLDAVCTYAFPVVVKDWELACCSYSCQFDKRGVTSALGGVAVGRWLKGADPLEYIESLAQKLVQITKRL